MSKGARGVVSEYQSYEFLALDRPLTVAEMAELRSVSTRAQITPTRFFNEYHWGDLKADPAELLARYFDVHVYFANWQPAADVPPAEARGEPRRPTRLCPGRSGHADGDRAPCGHGPLEGDRGAGGGVVRG